MARLLLVLLCLFGLSTGVLAQTFLNNDASQVVLTPPPPAEEVEEMVTIGPRIIPASRANCFPLGTATLNGTTPPKVSLEDWWCANDLQYGFMGFSLPLEATNCSDPSNTYSNISEKMSRSKHQFNASMVRIYAPQCRDESIWLTLLKEGINHNMAVLPMVWWGFDANQSLWELTADAIVAALEDPTYGPVAPYIFHSIAFGSEPIGDDVDGGPANFTADLKVFKAKIEPYGIPVTISEDWDRPGIMSNDDWSGLGPVGEMIAPVIDLVHVHIMPYYHANIYPTAATIWPYFETYIPFLSTYLPGKPLLISQTLWASEEGGSHDRGYGNPGENLGNFTEYWNILQSVSSCRYFKQYKVGWFVHTYDDQQETGLGMINNNNVTKMNFDPQPC